MINRSATNIVFAFCAVAVLAGSVARVYGDTSPATAPVSVNLPELVKQLGSDNAADRDSAQTQLEGLGPAAVESLKKAASNDDDPEIRSRATAVLAHLKERDNFLASLVTVHAKNQPIQDVLNTIGSQSHSTLIDGGPLTRAHRTGGQIVTLDAVKQPFWATVNDLCNQLNYCPDFGSAGTASLRLFPASRNWMTDSPHEIVGPYLISVAGISRTRSIDLLRKASVTDQVSIKVNLFPEPKIAVLNMSDFFITSAVDDAGNNLAPLAERRPQRAPTFHDPREVKFTAESKLNYPPHPGTKITSLSGEFILMLGQEFQQYQVDDVLNPAGKPHPLNIGNAQVTVTSNGGVVYQVLIQFVRADFNDDQWFIIQNNTIDLSLEDSEGRSLPGRVAKAVIPGGVKSSDAKCTITAEFFTGNPAHPKGTQTGPPARVKLSLPKSLRTITVPATLKDIPIP